MLYDIFIEKPIHLVPSLKFQVSRYYSQKNLSHVVKKLEIKKLIFKANIIQDFKVLTCKF